ncbi:hypothetical protein [Moraxella catarrhalis]|uniref:hypothetical protein n=1 Tax=Moraxella catarrhalis TaxID=480 RepID=UPI000A680DD9|nr:hypothetical protein [Moraxella catarrhalis]
MTDTAPIQASNKQVKSKKRVADFGEVFTAEREIRAMLDLVKIQTEQITSTFLEPACGTGNFLAEILRRKLTTALRLSQINKSQKSPNMPNFIMKNTPFVPYHQFMALSFWRIIVMSAVADCWIYS